MSTQPLYESDTEDNRNVISTRPATPLQQVSPSSSALSAESVWSRVSDWDPYITLMDSEKPFCTPAMYDGPGDATKSGGFYNVYVGDLPGCYRDWASAGSRVSGYPNNHHKKYKTYKDAMEGWKQYCLAHHQHSEDFVSGTVYELRAVSAPPSSIHRQSNHNVVLAVPSPKKYLRESSVSGVESPLSRITTPVKKSTRVSKSPTKPNDSRIPEHKSSPSKLTSPSFSISSPSSLSSASFSHAAAAGPSHYLGSQPLNYAQLPPRRRLWVIHTSSFNCVASAEEADRVLRDGGISGESVLVHEVSSIVEAERWLDSVEEEAE